MARALSPAPSSAVRHHPRNTNPGSPRVCCLPQSLGSQASSRARSEAFLEMHPGDLREQLARYIYPPYLIMTCAIRVQDLMGQGNPRLPPALPCPRPGQCRVKRLSTQIPRIPISRHTSLNHLPAVVYHSHVIDLGGYSVSTTAPPGNQRRAAISKCDQCLTHEQPGQAEPQFKLRIDSETHDSIHVWHVSCALACSQR